MCMIIDTGGGLPPYMYSRCDADLVDQAEAVVAAKAEAPEAKNSVPAALGE